MRDRSLVFPETHVPILLRNYGLFNQFEKYIKIGRTANFEYSNILRNTEEVMKLRSKSWRGE